MMVLPLFVVVVVGGQDWAQHWVQVTRNWGNSGGRYGATHLCDGFTTRWAVQVRPTCCIHAVVQPGPDLGGMGGTTGVG